MARRRRRRVAAILFGGVVCGASSGAACGGGDGRPQEASVLDSGSAGDATHPDGTTGHDGGDGQAATDGSLETGDGGGGAPEDITTEVIALGPDGGGLCDPTTAWGTPTPVLTTGAADSTIFGGVTPDELTLAWTSSTGGVVTAWYTDRASTAVPFGVPQALAGSLGVLAMDRITVSGDGLRLGAVASDGLSILGATRASRSVPFSTADKEFQGLGGGEAPPTLASPLLAGNDSALFYLLPSASSDYAVHESTTGPPAWKGGPSLDVAELARSGTSYRRPSGVSLDRLALFYWDEASGSEKLATRPVTSQPFNAFVDLGSLTNASPTASCLRIYYATPAADAGAGAITVVYADAIPVGD